MLDAAVRVSGAGGHAEGGERAARLAAHVQGAYAGRRRLPRMLHGAARELRPYDETDALGWRLLQLAARGQYAAEPLMCCAAAAAEGCLLLLTDLRLLCATAEGGRLLWHVPLREARAAHCSYGAPACLLTTQHVPRAALRATYHIHILLHICTCSPPCYRVPTKVRAVCTDHEHAAEAALLLSLATADDAAPDADESRRVVCRDEAAQRLLHDALLEVLIHDLLTHTRDGERSSAS